MHSRNKEVYQRFIDQWFIDLSKVYSLDRLTKSKYIWLNCNCFIIIPLSKDSCFFRQILPIRK